MRIWYVMLMCLMAIGCSQPKESSHTEFVGEDIGGGGLEQDFHLTDHLGRPASMGNFRGKVVVLFFGYTHCPDVCPTTMADLAKSVSLLGARQPEVQVLFVTLDPQRDTQQVLSKFVPSFDPSFLGLYGTESEIEQVAKAYKIYFRKQPAEGKAEYTIDHTAGVYVFDKKGRLKLYMNYGQKPQDIAHDLRLLL